MMGRAGEVEELLLPVPRDDEDDAGAARECEGTRPEWSAGPTYAGCNASALTHRRGRRGGGQGRVHGWGEEVKFCGVAVTMQRCDDQRGSTTVLVARLPRLTSVSR